MVKAFPGYKYSFAGVLRNRHPEVSDKNLLFWWRHAIYSPLYTRYCRMLSHRYQSRLGLDLRTGFCYWGPLAGRYTRQGYFEDRDWPTCLPPPTVDRPEFVEPWLMYWSYALAVHPMMLSFRPTGSDTRPDGGFELDLSEVPWERLRVPHVRIHQNQQEPFGG